MKASLRHTTGKECEWENVRDQIYTHLRSVHNVEKRDQQRFRGFVSRDYGKTFEAVLLTEKEDDPKDIEVEHSEETSDTFKIKQNINVLKVTKRPKKGAEEFEVSIKPCEFGEGLFYEGETPISDKEMFFGPYTGQRFESTDEFEKRNASLGYGIDDTPYAVYVATSDVWYDPGNIFDGQEHPLAKINMANTYDEMNVIFQEYKGKMYFKVIKPITKGQEFKTCYGGHYGLQLGIDMDGYYPSDCRYQHSAQKPSKRRRIGE